MNQVSSVTRSVLLLLSFLLVSACSTTLLAPEHVCTPPGSRTLADLRSDLFAQLGDENAEQLLARYTSNSPENRDIARRTELYQYRALLANPERRTYADVLGWSQYQKHLKKSGKLRLDRNLTEQNLSNEQLILNFREIMLFDEFVLRQDSYQPGRVERGLEKRASPVTFTIWGDQLSTVDRLDLLDIAERVQSASGLTLCETPYRAEIEVLILTRAERISLAAKVREAGAIAMANDLENDLEGLVCGAYLFLSDDTSDLVDYTIIIPNELSGLLRKSCIEEEFGQAFGPSADFDDARPSVFNDDEEFALFTEHDALLFRILYDPRLKDGMNLETAMPIVRQIVSEIRPNQ